jgi:hypothetical protein
MQDKRLLRMWDHRYDTGVVLSQAVLYLFEEGRLILAVPLWRREDLLTPHIPLAMPLL